MQPGGMPMPTLTKLLVFSSVYVVLFFFMSMPTIGAEPYTLACECEQYIAPEEAPAVIFVPRQKAPEEVIRAAIDIGSGATKLRVAEVNLKTHKIDRILVNQSFPVHYQEHLAKSGNNTFDEEVMQSGLDAIRQSKQIAAQHGAQKVIAVATASFRKAANSQAFIDRINREIGVPVFIIDQDLEGKLAYNAVLTQGQGKFDPHKLIVWDIGGGSLQLIALDKEGRHRVFLGDMASIPFKNMIIQDIQHKDINQVSTPNPLSSRDILKGIVKARESSQKVDRVFKDLIADPNVQIVGVGNIFAYGIYPIVGKKTPFTQQELYQATLNMADKNDQQLGGGDYVNVQVSNAMLVLGFMQGLNINHMHALDVNNADEAMLYPEFWVK